MEHVKLTSQEMLQSICMCVQSVYHCLKLRTVTWFEKWGKWSRLWFIQTCVCSSWLPELFCLKPILTYKIVAVMHNISLNEKLYAWKKIDLFWNDWSWPLLEILSYYDMVKWRNTSELSYIFKEGELVLLWSLKEVFIFISKSQYID